MDSAYHTGPGKVRLFEVTRDKQIVWTHVSDRKSGIHHFQILDTNGKPTEGRPLR